MHIHYQLNIRLNLIKHPLEFIPTNEKITLVSAKVNPANEIKPIVALFQDKLATLTATLN